MKGYPLNAEHELMVVYSQGFVLATYVQIQGGDFFFKQEYKFAITFTIKW